MERLDDLGAAMAGWTFRWLTNSFKDHIKGLRDLSDNRRDIFEKLILVW